MWLHTAWEQVDDGQFVSELYGDKGSTVIEQATNDSSYNHLTILIINTRAEVPSLAAVQIMMVL